MGLANEGKDFWIEIMKWDIVLMSETWMNEKRWDRCKEYLLKDYRWELQVTKRKSRKRRMIGVKKINCKIGEKKGQNGLIMIEVELGELGGSGSVCKWGYG